MCAQPLAASARHRGPARAQRQACAALLPQRPRGLQNHPLQRSGRRHKVSASAAGCSRQLPAGPFLPSRTGKLFAAPSPRGGPSRSRGLWQVLHPQPSPPPGSGPAGLQRRGTSSGQRLPRKPAPPPGAAHWPRGRCGAAAALSPSLAAAGAERAEEHQRSSSAGPPHHVAARAGRPAPLCPGGAGPSARPLAPLTRQLRRVPPRLRSRLRPRPSARPGAPLWGIGGGAGRRGGAGGGVARGGAAGWDSSGWPRATGRG